MIGSRKMLPILALVGLVMMSMISSLALADEEGEETRRRVAGALNDHIAVLEDVKAKVPAQAQGGINKAINESQRLRERVEDADDDDDDGGGPPDNQRGLARALAAVDEGTQRHLDTLNGLLARDDLSAEARAAITKALEVSARGRQVAMQRLQMIQAGETPRGRPEGVGQGRGRNSPSASAGGGRGRGRNK